MVCKICGLSSYLGTFLSLFIDFLDRCLLILFPLRYARRFLNPVKVEEIAACHSGLGLDCYAQWTSPIRRFGDLQVHSAVKRHLRRQRLVDILKVGGSIPPALTPLDLGCDISTLSNNEAISKLVSTTDDDLDYSEGSSLVGVARRLQRSSQRYWMSLNALSLKTAC